MLSYFSYRLLFLFVLHRLLSGVRNGAMYQDKSWLALSSVALMAFVLVFSFRDLTVSPGFGLFFPSLAFCMIAFMLFMSTVCSTVALFYQNPTGAPVLDRFITDLHLWTMAEQLWLGMAFVAAGWSGVAAVVAGVYPAVFLQKATINAFLGKGPLWNGTDDLTGQTFFISSLGLKVPRNTQIFRALLAALSLITFSIFAHYGSR